MPHRKNQRILWLLNHTTLREFEIPLLRELGFEVFTPKVIPNWKEFRSGSVTYEYDASLSIPQEDLDILNSHDFYFGEMPLKVRNVMNKYFGIAMPTPFADMTIQMVRHFKGRMFVRAFGTHGKDTYDDVYRQYGGPQLQRAIYDLFDRFWLAACYESILEAEHPFFQRNGVYLPLGIPEKFFTLENTWTGEKKSLLFVCPSIKSSPSYYGKIYKEFKRDFRGFPYAIAGEQSIPVRDSKVLGKLPRDAYDAMMQQSRVMYYHSREARHLHYHPLEAIIIGIPVIYRKGGLLDTIAGDHPQPGRAANAAEARRKINRILKGDQAFIEEVRAAQKILIEPFTHAYNKQVWMDNFVNGILKKPETPLPSPPVKKIAVMLPAPYKGGSLHGALNVARMIHFGSRMAGEPVQVVFSCVKGHYDLEEDFKPLHELGIEVRETVWDVLSPHEHREMMKLSFIPSPLTNYTGARSLPRDGVCDFSDCRHWLLISDRTEMPMARIKPFSMLVYDCLQRYVPEVLNGTPSRDYEMTQIENARMADAVFVTTPQTGNDVVQYYGINPHNVAQLPMEFDPLDIPPGAAASEDPYFLWTTNTAPHKNHMKALEALQIYYEQMDGRLQCVISGVNTEKLRKLEQLPFESSYTIELAKRLQESGLLNRKIKIMGYLHERAYIGALKHAAFLWHPAIADNGTFSVVEAAWHGTPSLSADYPQMRFMDVRFGLNLNWQDAQSPMQMAQALKNLEDSLPAARAKLPARAALEPFSYQHQAPAFWAGIREAL